MTIGALFAGMGGLDLGVSKVFGDELAWYSEFDANASHVMEYNHPGVPNLGDVTAIDWHRTPRVRILTGGSPCQDLSLAGKRAGMKSGTRSGLWESMREGVAVLRPQYVVWENVKGALSANAYSEVERTEGRLGGLRALGRVLGDLSSLGYDARWGVIRASDAGAPHRRERVFVLASNTYRESDRFGPVSRYMADPSLSSEGSVPSTVPLAGFGTSYTPEQEGTDRFVEEFGPYAPVVAKWAKLFREPPRGLNGNRLNTKFSEWMMGLPEGWVTAPEIGLNANQQSKILGNGVVPQQAELALRTLLAMGDQ